MHVSKLNFAPSTTKLVDSGNGVVVSTLVEHDDIYASPFFSIFVNGSTPPSQQIRVSTLHFSFFPTARDEDIKYMPVGSCLGEHGVMFNKCSVIFTPEVEEFIHLRNTDSQEYEKIIYTNIHFDDRNGPFNLADHDIVHFKENFAPQRQTCDKNNMNDDNDKISINKYDSNCMYFCQKTSSPVMLSDFEENIFYDEWKSSPLNTLISAQNKQKRLLNDDMLENTLVFEKTVTRDMPILTYPKKKQTITSAISNSTANKSKYFTNDTKPTTRFTNSDANIKTIAKSSNNSRGKEILSVISNTPKYQKKAQRINVKAKSNIRNDKVYTDVNVSGNVKHNMIQKNDPNEIKKCKEIESNIGINSNSGKKKARSRLFPTTMSVSSVPTKEDVRPALIADESVLSIPGNFQQIFKDCRVVFRKLKACNFEINDRCCAIFSICFSQKKSNDQVETEKIIEALIMFETVYLIIVKETSNLSYINQISVSSLKIRHFPTVDSALIFIRSMISYSQTFLRECETLHEHLLSLFPTISKSLAQAILRKGNPIADCSVPLNGFSQMNIYPFNFILDAISKEFQKNKISSINPTTNMIIKKNSNKHSVLLEESLASSYSFTPSIKKVKAPYPSSTTQINENSY